MGFSTDIFLLPQGLRPIVFLLERFAAAPAIIAQPPPDHRLFSGLEKTGGLSRPRQWQSPNLSRAHRFARNRFWVIA
jgi:hypothetical protein